MHRGFGLEIPETLEEICRPDRLALIVYDMQVGIMSQLAAAAAITERVLRVLAAARAGGYRIFHTRHMSLPNEVAGVVQLRTAMAWQRARLDQVRPAFLRDSPQFQLIPEINPRPSEAIFDKITMSCFVGTPLDLALRDCGINAFAIVGVALEVGSSLRCDTAPTSATSRLWSKMPAAGGTRQPCNERWRGFASPVMRC